MKRFRAAEGCEMENINMANVLLLFSGAGGGLAAGEGVGHHGGEQHPGRVFECKTCNRRFPSFQALGGHRASHKKPRLAGGDQLARQQSPPAPPKPRVHECSVCGLEFAIGQALGGHMRRHRAAAAEGGVPHELLEKKAPVADDAPAAAPAAAGGEKRELLCLGLDLNLPPSENDKDFLSLGFGRRLHMVDCSYC